MMAIVPPSPPTPARSVAVVRAAAHRTFRALERLSAPLTPLHHRLLDPTRTQDYAIASAIGLVPGLAALACGVFFNITPSETEWRELGGVGPPEQFAGILARVNWLVFYIAILPLALWCVRHVARRLFCLGTGQPCALVGLVGGQHRAAVSAQIAIAATRPSILAVVALLAIMLNLIDMGEVLQHYASYVLFDTRTVPREPDWSVMFLLEAGPPVAINFLFVVIVYSLQFLAILLGFLVFGLCLVHNATYLQLVYQRRRGIPPEETIVLDLNDENERFGQRDLHVVFDWQILYLLLAGIAILVSRYANVDADTGKLWSHLIEAVSDLKLGAALAAVGALFTHTTRRALFPDVGQVELLIGYAFCAVCVILPSFVKFLPYGVAGSLTTYLAEFVPPAGLDQKAEEAALAALAPEFAANSFWPAGDGLAKWLFGMVFFVLATILIPIPGEPLAALVVSTAVVVGVAYLATKALFFAYDQALRVVDGRLVR